MFCLLLINEITKITLFYKFRVRMKLLIIEDFTLCIMLECNNKASICIS